MALPDTKDQGKASAYSCGCDERDDGCGIFAVCRERRKAAAHFIRLQQTIWDPGGRGDP